MTILGMDRRSLGSKPKLRLRIAPSPQSDAFALWIVLEALRTKSGASNAQLKKKVSEFGI
jgi:hypothetical protein